MNLPNFIIIGAAKSGTTALYEYLRQHPKVFMSPIKEIRFFAFDGERPNFRGPRGSLLNRDTVYKFENYQALFDEVTDEIAIGEASPQYMWIPGTAARIKRRIPQVRLIAILRNPADSIFSAFSMFKRDGFEPCETISEAISDEPQRIREQWGFCIYTERYYYGRQLAEYYKYFHQNQIRVYLYEDLIRDPVGLLQDIFQFIDVDKNFVPNISKKHNVSGIIKNPLLRIAWTKTHPIRSILEPIISKRIRQRISKFFTNQELIKLSFPGETRRQLLDLYREDIFKLQNLIHRDLSHWLQ